MSAPARRPLWPGADGHRVEIIDQTALPHDRIVRPLATLDDAIEAIAAMRVRGAPLIGATAAYGMAFALAADPSDAALARAAAALRASRPTAVNLAWAVAEIEAAVRGHPPAARARLARARADAIVVEDGAVCRAIGEHGADIIAALWRRAGSRRPVEMLTHCNAGWLATTAYGTALAPVYVAQERGIPVHVWVDETRPRNQGASLTAWELGEAGIDHTLVADNAGGHLMSTGRVDLCITGTDRTTAAGDVCNKIGTYLKALAARDNGVPFYVALPCHSIDWSLEAGEIPIEQRDAAEVTHMSGRLDTGEIGRIALAPAGTRAANYAFDVTPARLITALITERGVGPASRAGLAALYPERCRA